MLPFTILLSNRKQVLIKIYYQAFCDEYHRPMIGHATHYLFYRKIHYLTREFRVKLHAKTDIARIAKR